MSSLSTTAEALYGPFAPVYDLLYGLMLEPGRRRAMQRLAPRANERILEVGVGTGWSADTYPRHCRVVAVDLSEAMVRRARARFARKGLEHVVLCRMDAAALGFPDASFDAIYAPYLVNVVPDAAAAAKEMLRVCRPGGRLVFLNHFKQEATETALDRAIGRLATRLSGVDWDLRLDRFLRDTGLEVRSLEAVNVPRVSSLLVCRKP